MKSIKEENNNIYLLNKNYSRELRQKSELHKDFEKMLTSQLDLLIVNWNLTLNCIVETDYDKVKLTDNFKILTKTLKVLLFSLCLKYFVFSNFYNNFLY